MLLSTQTGDYESHTYPTAWPTACSASSFSLEVERGSMNYPPAQILALIESIVKLS